MNPRRAARAVYHLAGKRGCIRGMPRHAYRGRHPRPRDPAERQGNHREDRHRDRRAFIEEFGIVKRVLPGAFVWRVRPPAQRLSVKYLRRKALGLHGWASRRDHGALHDRQPSVCVTASATPRTSARRISAHQGRPFPSCAGPLKTALPGNQTRQLRVHLRRHDQHDHEFPPAHDPEAPPAHVPPPAVKARASPRLA